MQQADLIQLLITDERMPLSDRDIVKLIARVSNWPEAIGKFEVDTDRHYRKIFDLSKIGRYANSNVTMIRDAR